MSTDGDRHELVPASFLAQPRWRADGASWISRLPDLADRALAHWRLIRDGQVRHGSNGIVIPVRRGADRFALKLTPPDHRVEDELRALRFWNGRGTVLLMDALPDEGALLLERLDGANSLATLSLQASVPLLAQMMRRLAVDDAPANVPSTASIAEARAAEMPEQWKRLNSPFAPTILAAAVTAGQALATTTSTSAVNADLHSEQVLAGERQPWLTVDPVLLRGDAEYDLARLLWTRLDEMADDVEILRHLDTIVREAGLEPERARTWAVFRTIDYWLWGLDNGLTEDPVRCARLMAALTG